MIHDLKPYPAYKDSGVPWLGEVPENWEVRRLSSSMASCINGTWGSDPNGREDIICVRVADFDRTRMRVRINNPTLRAVTVNERNQKQLCKGDLLLEKSGGGDLQPVGVVMLYDHDLPAVCSNFVARMTVAHGFEPAYLVYLHSCLYSLRLNVRSIKQTTGIQNLDSRAYLSEPVAFPPFPEQSAIVHYLDYIDSRIRRYIRTKQKLIKLLEEQKKAITHQAVTYGLDPNVKFKPSGVEWLGNVPEHWDLLRLKDAVFQIVDTEHKTAPFYENGNYLVVRTSNVKKGELLLSDAKYTDEAGFQEWTRRGRPEPGDILFTREAPAGEACLVPEDVSICLGQRMVLFRVNPEILNSQFGLYSIYGGVAAEFIRQLSLGSTVPHFNMFDIACIPMLLPPIGEQQTIANFLNMESKKLAEAIDHAHREISLLREYRTRLIADVVTGKLDVREAAANLPEELNETEVLDEELFEDEESTEENLGSEPEE